MNRIDMSLDFRSCQARPTAFGRRGGSIAANFKARFRKALSRWLNTRIKTDEVPATDYRQLSTSIRSGDVVLVAGRTRISRLVQALTHSRWTHVALCIGRMDEIVDPEIRAEVAGRYPGASDQPLLVEALLGRGTILSPLSHYRDNTLTLCRPKGLSAEEIQAVIRRAIAYLGYDYDLQQILDLGRYLLPLPVFPRRWRSNLFTPITEPGSENPRRCICTTMLVDCFVSVGHPVIRFEAATTYASYEASLCANSRLATPKDFERSPYFEHLEFPTAAAIQPRRLKPERSVRRVAKTIGHSVPDLPALLGLPRPDLRPQYLPVSIERAVVRK